MGLNSKNVRTRVAEFTGPHLFQVTSEKDPGGKQELLFPNACDILLQRLSEYKEKTKIEI